jgi:hypothetical protein
MKSIHSVVYFFVLKTVIADPQFQQSTTTTNSAIQQTSGGPSEEFDLEETASLAPANLIENTVGLTDTNRGMIIAGIH